jgi:hypothetical protein
MAMSQSTGGTSGYGSGTTYCTDYYDPYNVTINALGTFSGATNGKYQVIAIFDSSGNLLVSTSLVQSGSNQWNKFTANFPYALSAGYHSWCWASEAGGTAYSIFAGSSGGLNPGTTSAKIHNYSCGVATTGSGSSFAIAANGNCAASGTRTALQMTTGNPGGALAISVNP